MIILVWLSFKCLADWSNYNTSIDLIGPVITQVVIWVEQLKYWNDWLIIIFFDL